MGRLVAEALAWWKRRRTAAPRKLSDEIRAARTRLSQFPSSAPSSPAHVDGFRRVLLPATRYHLYYVVEEDRREVWVLLLWHGNREEPDPEVIQRIDELRRLQTMTRRRAYRKI